MLMLLLFGFKYVSQINSSWMKCGRPCACGSSYERFSMVPWEGSCSTNYFAGVGLCSLVCTISLVASVVVLLFTVVIFVIFYMSLVHVHVGAK